MRPITPTGKICITGMGMVTSLGLDIANSCAAARAGITRLSELRILNFIGDEKWGGEPVVGHSVPGIAEGFVGIAKALILSQYALKDLLTRREISSNELHRTGIFLNLSNEFLLDTYATAEREEMQKVQDDDATGQGAEWDEDVRDDWVLPSSSWKEECSHLIPRLLANCKIVISSSNQRVYFGDHAGIVSVIQDAIESIRVSRFDRCIIGGIDCCIEPRFLIAAAAKGVLKTSANPIGFVPGEAAGFFLLEKFEEAQSRGIKIASLLGSTATGEDKSSRFSDDPPRGMALAQTIDRVMSEFPHPIQAVGLIIADLNGDNYRAMDWGYTLVRLQNKYRLGDLPSWLPAAAFGETGAATGAISICIGTRALQRRYAPDGGILIWLSSDNGSKAAVCLESLYV
jgi:3-oxoacyl-[acyl-carrier-protein] synthase-1